MVVKSIGLVRLNCFLVVCFFVCLFTALLFLLTNFFEPFFLPGSMIYFYLAN